MLTRILCTEIWRTSEFRALDDKEQKIALFLLTNDKIPTLPCYKIALDEIAFYCGTTIPKVEETITKLEPIGVFYKHDYFFITDKFTRAKYTGGKTENARQKLWENYPDTIKELVDVRGSIGQSLGNHCSTIDIINKKQEIINNKSEIRNKKSKTTEEEKYRNASKVFLEWFNGTLGTSFKGIEFWKNLQHWTQFYSEDDLKRALKILAKGKWWATKPSPTLLFRQKDKAGQNVDYIGELLSLEKKRGEEDI